MDETFEERKEDTIRKLMLMSRNFEKCANEIDKTNDELEMVNVMHNHTKKFKELERGMSKNG